MKAITIVGGGLAGLTLGIALRQSDIPVEVFEAGDYPRHRVCGEFISGQGQATIERLGLLDLLHKAGANRGETAAFYSSEACCFTQRLPQPALAISRWALDAALARRFEAIGGTLHVNARWARTGGAPGIVHATGRRRHLSNNGPRWFGVKGHARKVELQADLEMHFLRGGYVGLCQLADGVVNVCALFWQKPENAALTALLSGEPGSVLHSRLANAAWNPDAFSAVAGLPIHSGLQLDDQARVGDALAMVPPLTGNGMSFAFESAELAYKPLVAFARGELGWATTCDRLGKSCRSRFRLRLSYANCLHKLILRDQNLAFRAAQNRSVWRLAFGATR